MPQETLKFVLLRLNLEAVLIKNYEAVAKCTAGQLNIQHWQVTTYSGWLTISPTPWISP